MKSNKDQNSLSVVGKKVVRLDGYEKVTGEAIYGDDLNFPGMLHACCKYTDIPCGKITNINLKAATKHPSAVSIITAEDIPGTRRLGPIRQDHYPLVEDRVFYTGDVSLLLLPKVKKQL